MKKILLGLLLLILISGAGLSAQNDNYSERFGRTLNLGVGIGGYSGYYGYIGHMLPVISANYEFDVVRSFTLAPFATIYSYREGYYRETVIPLGVKASYYFDNLLRANSNWDFYLAGSLGFAFVSSKWYDGHQGDGTLHSANPLFIDMHLGIEYHLNDRLGIFLDLSTGVSTLGLAFH
ncbi:MAG: hypothetical protein A2X22_05895 [Bacteroidetes bacterium GWF2_49_14]|nr:MAG: hypothetical protein A2X22_05895 [Bacteroidetes bacterium GWF2_49_14]HBB91925.1 hypothetical protein [Bacteroidales bacterium]